MMQKIIKVLIMVAMKLNSNFRNRTVLLGIQLNIRITSHVAEALRM